jgi:hypothetical protein
MANWEFYDEGDEIDGSDEREPSFSLQDFKKWLSSQKGKMPASLRETAAENKKIVEDENKDRGLEEFKKRVHSRVNKNIERKLAERKKKKS